MKNLIREVVKLGHAEGMVVIGYFSIAANKRWGTENPELSYGTPDGYHLPYTDEYLAYVAAAITDAVKNTGINGFMIDWIWQPNRKATEGKWLDAEKKLYQQLMGEPFPGEDKLTSAQDLEYSRRAIDRCWKTIRKAAKDANPNCIVWLTCNNIKHPHIQDSDMFREVDWLMAETGNNKHLEEIRNAVGEHTRLAPTWPATRIRLYWRENQAANVTRIRITNGTIACEFPLEENAVITWGTKENLLLGDKWSFKAIQNGSAKNASVKKSPEVIEIDLPEAFFEGNPEAIAYEWLK